MSAAVDTPQIKSTSLYVGDLHPLVSDALLFTKFSELGPVVNARVCRDMISRESLGYGYVNYRDPKDAEQALECMNYSVLYGRPFRLMWSQKDPTLRKSGKGNVFIKNLDKSITPSELYDTFEQFGKILSCKLSTDENGISKGFGFVHFETEEAAQKAVSYVNGKEIRNRILFVGPFIPKSERKSTGGAAKFNNCYVKNFGEDMDDDKFRKMFEKFGEIKSACVMRNDQGTSKGFGFVCFEDPISAEQAVRELDGHDINGKPLYVGRAQRKEERREELKAKFDKQRTERQSRYASGVNLYVKNLDDTIDDEKLRDAFSRFGDITSAKVMRDANGMSRSFGFVCFRNAEHATLAVTNMNAQMLGNKPLYVAIAQRKEDRKAKLTADYQARMEQMRNQVYPMGAGGLGFMHAAPPTAGYQPNRAFFGRQYPSSGPRWQQTMMPNVPMAAGSQAYQAGLAGQSAGHPMAANFMQLRNNQAGNAALASRVGTGAGMGAVGGSQMAQYARQPQNRQITSGGMNLPAGMQNRVNMQMPQQNVSMMQNRGPQMQQGPAQGAVTGMGNRAGPQMRSAMPQQPPQSSAKDLSHEDEDIQRQMLGSRLYQHIEPIYPKRAAKISGMILSMPLAKVASLFDEPQELEQAVKKAYTMLNDKEKPQEDGTKAEDGN